jgi:hypothetical protein
LADDSRSIGKGIGENSCLLEAIHSFTMLFSLPSVIKLVALCAPFMLHVSGLAPSDEYRDADIGQSSYLGGDHNMDPAVVDSSQFGLLWKIQFNNKEKVRMHHRNHCDCYKLSWE